MKKLYLNIVSPEKEIYNGEVEECNATWHDRNVYHPSATCTHCVFAS